MGVRKHQNKWKATLKKFFDIGVIFESRETGSLFMSGGRWSFVSGQ